MSLKKEFKIRKMLGDRFHLYTDSKGNWVLFRKFYGDLYFSEQNKPIMTNETHSGKDLLKFARKNREYNVLLILSGFRVMLAIINVILCFTNVFLHINALRWVTMGINFVIITECIVHFIINDHNWKIDEEYHKEIIKLIMNQKEEK